MTASQFVHGFAVVVAVALLTSCGGQSNAPQLPTFVGASGARSTQQTLPLAPFQTVRARAVYAANRNNSITSYPATVTGNVSPTTVIAGSATQISNPAGVFIDSTGQVWVANFDTPGVTAYSPGASGNVAPVVNISGNKTGLSCVTGVHVSKKGTIYASDRCSNAVSIWPEGANGNVPPSRKIIGSATGLDEPNGIWVDDVGLIYVANYACAGGCDPAPSVTIYRRNADGDATPVATISGSNTGLTDPTRVTLDRVGTIYVLQGNEIRLFAPGARGNVSPIRTILVTTADATDIAVDHLGYIYVSGYVVVFGKLFSHVLVFNPEGVEVQDITGSATQLSEPIGVAER